VALSPQLALLQPCPSALEGRRKLEKGTRTRARTSDVGRFVLCPPPRGEREGERGQRRRFPLRPARPTAMNAAAPRSWPSGLAPCRRRRPLPLIATVAWPFAPARLFPPKGLAHPLTKLPHSPWQKQREAAVVSRCAAQRTRTTRRLGCGRRRRGVDQHGRKAGERRRECAATESACHTQSPAGLGDRGQRGPGRVRGSGLASLSPSRFLLLPPPEEEDAERGPRSTLAPRF
jgi:hypothetical protein